MIGGTWALFSLPSSILIRNNDNDGDDDDEETQLRRLEGGAVKARDKDTLRSFVLTLALRSRRGYLYRVEIVIKCHKVYCDDFAPAWRVWVADEFIVKLSALRSSHTGLCCAFVIRPDFSERGESSIPALRELPLAFIRHAERTLKEYISSTP